MKRIIPMLLMAALLISLLPAPAYSATGRAEIRAPINRSAFLSDVNGWPGYEFVFHTPAFSKTGTAVTDFTDNGEMVSYLKSLLPKCANMYYFSLGISPTYKLEFPLVVFTKTDLTGMSMEQAGAAVYANGKATVLHQAQIHGNEPAAGEGALALAGALAGGHLKDSKGGDILDSVNIMIIPRINPDGSRDFRRNNSANNINMNRDYLVLHSSEVGMVLRAYNAFLPDVVIDAHEWTPNTSSGTGFFDDLQLWAAGSLNSDSRLLDTSIDMMETVFAAGEAQGIRPYFYQGVMTFGAGSNSIGPWYYGLRGTFGFCVETRGIGIGWKNFERRVFSQYIASESFIQYTADHAGELRTATEAERARIAKIGETYEDNDMLVLRHKSRSYSQAYRRPTVNADSDSVIDQNTTSTPTIYDVAGRTRTRPTAYIIPAGTTNLRAVLSTLDKHGITYLQLENATSLTVQQYSGSGSSASLSEAKTVTFPVGSYLFPMNQSGGNVLAMLMEPDVNDTASPSEALSTFVQRKTLSATSIYRYTDSLDSFADSFKVKFCKEDGTLLQTLTLKRGSTAFYTGEIPTKDYTEETHFLFTGWVNEDGSPGNLNNIITDCIFYPSFTAEAHSYRAEVTVPSTCTHTGLLLYTCDTCGRSYEEAVNLLPHSTELRNMKEATCTQPGYTGDEFCIHCNRVIRQGQVIPLVDHTPITVPGRAATCLSSGFSDSEICGACGKTLIPQQVLPRLGHSYIYTDQGDGTHKGACTGCGKATATAIHSYDEGGSCTLCGSTASPIVDASIQIRHTLDLLSDISIHYVVEAAPLASYDSFYLKCELPRYDGSILNDYRTVEIEPVLRGAYYYFTLDGITATQMGDEISSTLYMTKASTSYCSRTDLYSVATYAYSQLEKNVPNSLKALCAELLRYGASAQIYKGYRTNNLADRDMTSEQLSYLCNLDSVPFGNLNRILDDLENPSVTWVGKSLDLGSKVCIRFVANIGGFTGLPSNLSLRLTYKDCSGQNRNLILTDPTLYREGTPYYAFDFTGLTATELREPLTAVVYCGEEQVSPTMEYSADTYGNGKTGDLKTLCSTLFAYSDAAAAYFASIS